MRQASDYGISTMCLAALACVLLSGSMAEADLTFGEPVNLGSTVNSRSDEGAPCISADGLELYFCSNRPGGFGGNIYGDDIWMARRETIHDDWGSPVNLGAEVNSPMDDYSPCISADGLSLYFTTYQRPGGVGWSDIWVATRETVEDPWGNVTNLGPPVNTATNENEPSLSTDGLSLFFHSYRSGNITLYAAHRATTSDAWSQPYRLDPVIDGPGWEGDPAISSDGRVLFFTGDPTSRWGKQNSYDLFLSARVTADAPWSTPVDLGAQINSAYAETMPCISCDGSTLYFCSTRPSANGVSWDLWEAPVVPIVDLSGDGKVDGADVSAIADSWDTHDPLCDIGPMPWGDGVVDIEDVKALAEYIGEDVIDGTLIAHWALDETEGDVARDSVGQNDGTLMGDPVWEPDAGMVNGALAFDGVDDSILIADEVLDPADGAFSVLAWIKGGEPGQVLISQVDGMNWLIIDPSERTLATELVPPAGRFPVPPLVSDVAIIDGLWHRIAFVWDGAWRSLYVDGTLVVADEQSSLAECSGGLNIGCGKDMAPDTFFSGLIDDVRIYNRAARP